MWLQRTQSEMSKEIIKVAVIGAFAVWKLTKEIGEATIK